MQDNEQNIVNEELLEDVVGGAGTKKVQPIRICCEKCGRAFWANLNSKVVKCKYCNHKMVWEG